MRNLIGQFGFLAPPSNWGKVVLVSSFDLAPHLKSREKFCFLNVLKMSYSRTCLPKNASKLLFHCFVYDYEVSVLMVVGVQCAPVLMQ
ncbi:hypothetical protein T4E_10749 [Trichinella pseudospiralis]|uniref:Uncharacterized protein n=1 Tax=Trichinella pseudospiralis TaxID=6337 RepID=A0A0V0Y733_TRIPS|nr:hypothetical protein T4E_10749 [Trichinella pseudospiralis]